MFKLRKSTDGQFYFVLCAKNQKVILTSETYKRKENAHKGIAAIITAFSITQLNIKDETGSGK
jgi:hypothetical protein